ncbi:hypothetical protein DV515_00008951 [Chloebia gouldiae]|uniref:Uncharacterized protein n=1 Tax=Chloebia gouldiae TaxID=44316 RepID=A0A3L8SEM0_CHLGU|nr:hypothetical protein DV515_00008951 [Chloebia gouldiae]
MVHQNVAFKVWWLLTEFSRSPLFVAVKTQTNQSSKKSPASINRCSSLLHRTPSGVPPASQSQMFRAPNSGSPGSKAITESAFSRRVEGKVQNNFEETNSNSQNSSVLRSPSGLTDSSLGEHHQSPCMSLVHCPVMSLPSIIHAFISIPYELALPSGALFSSSGPQHVNRKSPDFKSFPAFTKEELEMKSCGALGGHSLLDADGRTQKGLGRGKGEPGKEIAKKIAQVCADKIAENTGGGR